MGHWKAWQYKSLTLFFLGIIFAVILFNNSEFRAFILHLGSWGYFGAFLAGMIFVTAITASTGAAIFFTLTNTISPLEIAIIAGLGAIVGDYVILRFLKDNLFYEIQPFYMRFGGSYITNFFHKEHMRWALPIIGAIFIASPLPDEIGITLMGISKIKTYKFILLSFALNSIGIFLLLSAFTLLK